MSGDTAWHTVTIRIPFASNHHAVLAKRVIDVDPELQKDMVKRRLTVEGDDLVATFQTLTVRLARLAVNGFLENIDVVVRTIGEFGEAVCKGKSQEVVTETGSESK